MTKNLWMLAIMMACALSLTSCYIDEDENVGYNVRGHWFGDMDMWIDGEKARGSEIEFQPRGYGYSYGEGIEVDYYYRGSITHYFDYEIRNGIIYLQFDDPNLDCAIVDYRLTYNYFTGYIADSYTLKNLTYFNLRNYDRYWDSYGYGGYIYTREQTLDTDSLWNDSTATRSTTENQEPKCIRGVNRIKD
ncbi:MAG: hypothetical protein IJT19_04540 [Bacteroidaceae bacterium]|nr:hypothetical protein [Bacteroidaceae bacterium]